MITLQLSDLLLAFIAFVLLGGTVVVCIVGFRALAVLRRVDRIATELEPLLPRFEAMADEAEATLADARGVAERARAAAGDVEVLTAETRQAAVPLIHEASERLSAAMTPLKHLTALGVGLKAAVHAFGNHRGRRR